MEQIDGKSKTALGRKAGDFSDGGQNSAEIKLLTQRFTADK